MLRRPARICGIVLGVAFVTVGVARADDDAKRNFFEARIRPVLVEHCYSCHAAGAKTLRGGLRLDHRAGLLQGGNLGPALAPGKPRESRLLSALRHAEGLEMPPDRKLPGAVVKDFEQWIADGAVDPRVAEAPAKAADLASGRKHWAYQPVADPAPPTVKNSAWPRDELDRFLVAKLEHAGLRPAGDADRSTWLRRISFDLTGLPPTPAELQAFVGDASPEARAKVADRLLASRAFGERWARHWLDLVGYADQVGTSNDIFAEHAWRYRDYLIDAFNGDKPFDRFLCEQLAGDLLPHAAPAERAANLAATGFLVLGDVEIVNPDKLLMEADLVDQQVGKVGTVFMAQTLACVRCHDHKFDPFPREDYYGIAGIFRSTVSTRKIPYGIWSGIETAELPETPAQRAERQRRDAEHRQTMERWRGEQTALKNESAEVAEKLKKPGAEKAALEKRRDAAAGKLRALEERIVHAEFFKPGPPRAFAVHDAARPADWRIAVRGNPHVPGAVVPRSATKVASPGPLAKIPANESGRRQLADWLADPRHPLTARVAVNRLWQKLFGEGLVRSVDYFGTRGERPTHPELLDHLATRFVRDGWSVKRTLRRLVLSRAYGMSGAQDAAAAKADPDNRLLWRMAPQRLDAEALRDAMLLASGELRPSRGGPSLPLEYPENTESLQPQAVNPPLFRLRKFRPTQETERTVYLPIVRSMQPELARVRDAFDFTQPAQIAGRRPQTVVPTQALFLLNNDLPRRRAAALATALLAKPGSADARLEELWLRVLNRPIAGAERQEASDFLAAFAVPKTETQSWTELAHALFASNEFVFRR